MRGRPSDLSVITAIRGALHRSLGSAFCVALWYLVLSSIIVAPQSVALRRPPLVTIPQANAGDREHKKIYYAESWKHGTRRIKEQKIKLKLDAQNRRFEAEIKDLSETYSYSLEVVPLAYRTFGEKLWAIELWEPGDQPPLLQTHDKSGHEFFIEDRYRVFYPVEDANFRKTGYVGIPLSAKRVFKIESFYCIVQVTSYRLDPKRWRVLESLELEIEFTNTYKLER